MLTRLLIVCLTLIALPLFAKPLIMFDAGSSGTRIYVYELEDDKVTSLHSYKVKPGLSSLNSSDSAAMDKYFHDLVKSAEGILNAQDKADTPMYLYATAGVRMMPQDQQEKLMHATQEALTKQAAAFGYPQPKPENIRPITGTEEALFIWLTNNYLSGNLNRTHLSEESTYTALEMGGASSEIGYLTQSTARSHTFPFKHHMETYSIYGYAYDGLGSDKAIASLYASQKPEFAACFFVGAPYPLNQGKIIGSGDFDTCVQAIADHFVDPQAVEQCHEEYSPAECSKFGVYQPEEALAQKGYVLTAGFYYVFNAMGLADQPVVFEALTDQSRQFCSQTWEEAQTNAPSEDPNFLINYCFNAALTQTLLEAWRVSPIQTLKAVSNYHGAAIEWPLGAALYLR